MSVKTSNELKQQGFIKYFFKGMQMRDEPATIVSCSNEGTIVVRRDVDGQLLSFVPIDGNWLLKDNICNSSLLCGTRFVHIS